MAVAEDERGHVDSIAFRPLHGVATAVDLRRHTLDLDPRRRLGCLRKWHDRGVSMICKSQTRATAPLLRNLLASDLAAWRRLDADAYRFVDWLEAAAANPGGRYCRSDRRTSSARRTARPRPSPRRRPCSPSPGARSRNARSRTSWRVTRIGRASGRNSGARARSPTRCGSSGSGRRSAITRASRRAADR